MFQMPPVPSWDALHPLIIHFPIALLLVAPLFVVAALLLSAPKRHVFMISALALMILGTSSVYFAVETGEAAKLSENTTQVKAVLERHEHLAEKTRLMFTLLTAVLACILVVPPLLKWKPSRAMSVIVSVVFLVLYGGAAQVLIDTAHNGGRLVHEFGVTALAKAPTTTPAQVLRSPGAEIDRD